MESVAPALYTSLMQRNDGLLPRPALAADGQEFRRGRPECSPAIRYGQLTFGFQGCSSPDGFGFQIHA